MAFVFELQTLWLKDFTEIFQLKGLKLENKGHTNFYECCDLTKKVYLSIPILLTWRYISKIFAVVLLYCSSCNYLSNNNSFPVFSWLSTVQLSDPCTINYRKPFSMTHTQVGKWNKKISWFLQLCKSNLFWNLISKQTTKICLGFINKITHK